MKAVNLYLLTRMPDHMAMSGVYQSLSGLAGSKMISPHEAASLCALTDLLTDSLTASQEDSFEWMPLLDGFFFSYVIAHIGKEFDLLKISPDGECVLNIELKSEEIGEERIKKQLEQNRYYLSHTAEEIHSFTYVMDTGTLYTLNDKCHFRTCSAGDLIRVLQRPSLQDHLTQDIDRFFRSSDYLISPVAAPEKFLQGQYFLTNQQFDFRRRILDHMKSGTAPVISITGSAGTGKTLLLFDLAMVLSHKDRVLLIHSGLLRQGHLLIDQRLRNVDIRSSAFLDRSRPELSEYAFLMADEADHLSRPALDLLLTTARTDHIPLILAYDPHQLLGELPQETNSGQIDRISASCTLSLAFTGNIRINRPVYSFLRTLLHRKDHSGRPDYSCIDVLYAADLSDLQRIIFYYQDQGSEWINPDNSRRVNNTVSAQEYGRVLFVINEDYYYDDTLHLCVKNNEAESIRLLYEALSRTRERLCLIVAGNEELFLEILSIRLHRETGDGSVSLL